MFTNPCGGCVKSRAKGCPFETQTLPPLRVSEPSASGCEVLLSATVQLRSGGQPAKGKTRLAGRGRIAGYVNLVAHCVRVSAD